MYKNEIEQVKINNFNLLMKSLKDNLKLFEEIIVDSNKMITYINVNIALTTLEILFLIYLSKRKKNKTI